MIEKMKALIKEREMCVLATCAENRPHCSLMAYVADETGDVIYMMTLNTTQKFKNLSQNPRVSLLVDTRDTGESAGRSRIQALTVSGIYLPMGEKDEEKRIVDRIVERHPHLGELARHPEIEVLRIRVESLLLLDGPVDAYHETLR